MGATIFSTRFAVKALGIDAFGVFVATAGVALIFAFITGSMTTSTQRILTMGLASDQNNRARVYNACLGPHLVVALLIILIGETVGVWLLNSVLSIPEDLRASARLALRLTIAATALGAFLAPYQALLEAHERFGLFAMLDIFRALILLCGSYWLLSYSGDRLVGYAVVAAGSTGGVVLLGAIIGSIQYPEARMRSHLLFDKQDLRRRWGFFSWTLFGSLSAVARNQGFAILANIYFGPQGSAAFGVANQVLGALRQLSSTVVTVITPRVFKYEATGQRDQMLAAALASSKYASFFAALIGVPLIVEADGLLTLWLGIVPPGASTTLVLLVVAFLFDQLSGSIGVAHLAIGRIAIFQLVCGLIMISAVPIGYAVGVAGGDLAALIYVLVATSVLIAPCRLILLESRAPGVIRKWLYDTVKPSFMVFAAALLAALGVSQIIAPGLERLALTTLTNGVVMAAAVFATGLSTYEKQTLGNWLTHAKKV